jgi:hypothetical protein
LSCMRGCQCIGNMMVEARPKERERNRCEATAIRRANG